MSTGNDTSTSPYLQERDGGTLCSMCGTPNGPCQRAGFVLSLKCCKDCDHHYETPEQMKAAWEARSD